MSKETRVEIEGPIDAPKGLVGEERCRELVWPDEKSRPSRRWFLELKARGQLPYHRVGRRIFFDPDEVRKALDRQFKVNPRN